MKAFVQKLARCCLEMLLPVTKRPAEKPVPSPYVLPWYPIENLPGLAEELRRQAAPGHKLFGVPVRAIARRQNNDDVLFQIEDGSGRVAVVHLTWKGKVETDPTWPFTGIYDSLESWVATGMIDDEEFDD